MKKVFKIMGICLVLIGFSCDLDKDLDNPNEVGPSTADPTLLMNGVQRDLASFYERVNGQNNDTTVGIERLVRMRALSTGATYPTAYQPQDMNDIWQDAYQKILVNIEVLLPLAEKNNLTTHIGVAKIIKAYVYLTLVDIFGDIPATEALAGGAGNLNPKSDSGSDVYAVAIALLGEARAELAKTGSEAGGPLPRDAYYGGNRANWTALANSLELKAQLNMTAQPSLKAAAASRITALLSENLIDTDAEEFIYRYGTSAVPASSKHPYYRETYQPVAASAAGWISNYYLKELFNGLGVQDPRWRYYFYRQVGSLKQALAVDPKSITCINANVQYTGTPSHYTAIGAVYCAFDPGFFGRDHGDDDGRNPDAPVITVPGVYPVGGRPDLNPTGAAGNPNYHGTTINGQGANGAGILPIYMSFFTDFMKAEIAIRLDNDPASAKTHMLNGVNKSINRVRAFAVSKGQTLPAGLEPPQVIYVSTLGAAYDGSADPMDVVAKEYHKSLWGNGLEAYNMYRRTGYPKNMQPMRAIPGTEGSFWRSMVYPAVHANLNANAPSNEGKANKKVFWDGNPDILK